MGQRSSRAFQVHAVKLLENAVVVDDAESLHHLLAEGAITHEDLDNFELLHLAASLGHVACLVELLAHGASVHVRDERLGWTPMHHAAAADEGGSRCVWELLRAGAIPTSMGRCGQTALHIAIEGGSLSTLRVLTQSSSLVNTVSECEKGISPLLLAAQMDRPDAFRIILEAGADLRKCWMWKTAYMAPLDLITHRMHRGGTTGEDSGPQLLNLLLQADGHLQLTLCMMPQGQRTKVGAVRTLCALRTVVQRLDKHHRRQAWHFLLFLIISGYKPRGESAAFVEVYAPRIFLFLQHYVKSVPPLKHLCVRVVRKHLQRNVLYGLRQLEDDWPIVALEAVRMAELPSLPVS